MRLSKIGYADYSSGNLNFATGCSKISEGCKNCFAAAIYERFGRDFTPTAHPDRLARLYNWHPSRYSDTKRGDCKRPLAFVCDTGDLLHPAISDLFIQSAFSAMSWNESVIWLVLTKRPERIPEISERPDHVWLGVSVENQDAAWRIAELLKRWPGHTWVSVEPMLGPVDLRPSFWDCDEHVQLVTREMALDAGDPQLEGAEFGEYEEWSLKEHRPEWIVCGAESGPHRRPFDKAWAMDLYEQCRAAGVKYFGKQASGLRPGVPLGLPQEWPEEM